MWAGTALDAEAAALLAFEFEHPPAKKSAIAITEAQASLDSAMPLIRGLAGSIGRAANIRPQYYKPTARFLFSLWSVVVNTSIGSMCGTRLGISRNACG